MRRTPFMLLARSFIEKMEFPTLPFDPSRG